jgi:hypothetical protein
MKEPVQKSIFKFGGVITNKYVAFNNAEVTGY